MPNLTRALLLLGLAGMAACDSPTDSGDGVPASLEILSGDLQPSVVVGSELPEPLVIRVLDDKGKPVENQIVSFVVTAGGGSVFAGAALTNEDGEARERWKLGTVAGDTQRVEARAVDPGTGEKLVFATFRAVARAGAPSTIAAVGSAQVTGLAGLPLADSVAVIVRDAFGNPVPGTQVAWQVTSGGGSVSPPTSTTNAQGITRARWTLGGSLAGPQTLQASAGVGLGTTFTANAGVGPGAVLTRVSGDAQAGPVSAELAQPLVVEVRQNGIPVAGAQVVWAPAPGMGTATPATSVTDTQGRASTEWVLGPTGGTQTMAAQVQGASAVLFFSAQATPGAPASLEVVAPPSDANPGYNGRNTLYVRVRDAQGNPVPNAAVSWTVLNGGGTIPAQSTTGADGIAWAVWQLGPNAGNQGVMASIAGVDPVLHHWSLVNSRPATTLTRVTGDGQTPTLGVTVDRRMVVRLADALGNGIYDARVEWVGPGGDVLAIDSTDIEGRSVFWARAGSTLGPETFTARTAGVPDVTFTVTAVPGPPDGVRVGRDTLLHTSGTDTGGAIPYVLYDAAGQPMSLGTSGDYMAVSTRLLDNTGAIELVTLGHNIRSHGYRALAMGSDRIEVRRSNGAADTVMVHVREPVIEPGMVIGNQGTMPYALDVGQAVRATVFVVWDATTIQGAREVTWSSSNPSVATVDGSGNIAAVAPGMAVITAQGMWGGTVSGYVLVRHP